MIVSTSEPTKSLAPLRPRAITPRVTSLTDQHADPLARELPLELAFLAAEGFSPEWLLSAANSAPDGVLPVDQLLSEGKITEEIYYRALASHLGCQYYCGDHRLARNFDPVKALRCSVAPLKSNITGARIVVAPRTEFVPRLIKATRSGAIRSGSFALTSPQQFASLVRAYHSFELLNVALGRLPTSLTARQGTSGWQVGVLGAVTTLAIALGTADFGALQAVSAAILWLMFSSSVMLRSMAAVASGPGTQPADLSDDNLPAYTIVIALYRESSVVEDLVKAITRSIIRH